MLPWQHYFLMTTTPTATVTARRTTKNDLFILTNNNFARASRYFVGFFAVVAQWTPDVVTREMNIVSTFSL